MCKRVRTWDGDLGCMTTTMLTGTVRLLFAGLARHDGRLRVLTARSRGPVGLRAVVLRDHVRHTWLRMRRIEQLAPDAQGSTPQRTGLRRLLGEPGC